MMACELVASRRGVAIKVALQQRPGFGNFIGRAS